MAHGHDDHHHHGPAIKATLIWSALIIVGFIIAALYLRSAGLEARAAGGEATGQSGALEPPQTPRLAAGVSPEQAGRIGFARRFEQGQRNQGFTFRARASGPHAEVLQVRWEGKADPGKVDTLRQGSSFHQAAKRAGFSRFQIYADNRLVWEKVL